MYQNKSDRSLSFLHPANQGKRSQPEAHNMGSLDAERDVSHKLVM
jgi:hypothetical protein